MAPAQPPIPDMWQLVRLPSKGYLYTFLCLDIWQASINCISRMSVTSEVPFVVDFICVRVCDESIV
jgi:hypothetical protein